MKATFITALLIALSATLNIANAQTATQHYELDVKDFIELKVVDGINVDYKCNPDSAGKAVFNAPASMTSKIMFEPKNGKLTIQLDNSDAQTAPTDLPTVTVYSRYLTSVENDGDSLVRVLSMSPGPKFKARLIGNGRMSIRDIDVNEAQISLATGNGSIVVSGRCELAKLYLTGTGTISADELKATKVNCRLSGTGNIGCLATETLSVKGIGSGTVFYHGSPEITNRSLGLKLEAIK